MKMQQVEIVTVEEFTWNQQSKTMSTQERWRWECKGKIYKMTMLTDKMGYGHLFTHWAADTCRFLESQVLVMVLLWAEQSYTCHYFLTMAPVEQKMLWEWVTKGGGKIDWKKLLRGSLIFILIYIKSSQRKDGVCSKCKALPAVSKRRIWIFETVISNRPTFIQSWGLRELLTSENAGPV